MDDVNAPCPKCGKKSLEKKRLLDGRYTIICRFCGLERGKFVPDDKKGVV